MSEAAIEALDTPETTEVDSDLSASMPATAAHVGEACAHHQHGYIDHKEDLLKRLRRAEGQVRGVHRMVDDDEYCIDILTQVSAATKALERVALALLDDHLRHCVASASTEGGTVADEKLQEASAAIARLVR